MKIILEIISIDCAETVSVTEDSHKKITESSQISESYVSPTQHTSPANASHVPKRVRKGKRVQITHTLKDAMLDDLDIEAKRMGITRAGLINLAISHFIEKRKLTIPTS